MPQDFEYRIFYRDLPYSIKAFTVYCDGFYNIFVNSRLSHEQNKKSILHEFEHIMHNDFDSNISVDSIERLRHPINRPFP